MPNAAPELKPCPQCQSLHCGPIRCRFSGLAHEDVVPLLGAPYYGPDIFTDPDDLPELDEDEPLKPGFTGDQDDDHYADDPRRR